MTKQLEHERPWKPLTVNEVASLFSGATFFWCVAGGFAIEHFAGRAFRAHGDIDVLFLRRDASAVRQFLAAWDCWMADPPGRLRPWPIDETLPSHAHDVWCRKDQNDLWRLQLMFDETHGSLWKSRRDPRITREIDNIVVTDSHGARFLVPEIQLFYKAKAPRPKDQTDFETILPLLSAHQRAWLALAIDTVHGNDHPWLVKL